MIIVIINMHTNILCMYVRIVWCPLCLTAEVSDDMSDSDEDQEGKLRPSNAGAISVPLGWPKVNAVKITVAYCAEKTMLVTRHISHVKKWSHF